MALQRFKRHDTDSPLVLDIIDAAGAQVDTAGWTGNVNIVRVAEFARPSNLDSDNVEDFRGLAVSGPLIQGQITEVGSAKGQNAYYWQDGDLEYAGVYEAEVEFDKPGTPGDRTQTTLSRLTFLVEPDISDDPLSAGAVVIDETTLDSSGAALGTVPVGATVLALRDGEVVAQIKSANGGFTLGVDAGSTYQIVALYPGRATRMVEVIA